MPFDTSLLGETLDELTTRLDTHGTALTRWVAIAPTLGRANTVAELITLLKPNSHERRAQQMDRWDALLTGLLQVAADGSNEPDAVLLVIHAIVPGAVRLQRRGLDADLILGQLTIQICTYPWQTRTRAVAANLLLDTENALLRETRPAYMRTRDRARDTTTRVTVTEIVTADPIRRATDPPSTGDGYDDLDVIDVLRWAERTGVVEHRDLAMLIEYHYAREFTGAGHDHVARHFGVSTRTSKRRCKAALAALQEAAPRYLVA